MPLDRRLAVVTTTLDCGHEFRTTPAWLPRFDQLVWCFRCDAYRFGTAVYPSCQTGTCLVCGEAREIRQAGVCGPCCKVAADRVEGGPSPGGRTVSVEGG
jgi:hypothetical protein